MKPGEIITDDKKIKNILDTSKTIAVLGLSPKPERASNQVSGYLKAQGYRIIPIRPGEEEILGEKVYASLDDVNGPIDIIDVFRKFDEVMAHAHEAIRLKPKVFWMQLYIENKEAAALLTEAGIDVIMNRCIKVEHGRLFDQNKI
ncbi:MAG: CoA-binding protein [Deltaproteobacteria bacterium]|nr:CoA-binding protein [Deltaproteobacteria bacterium]MBW2538286.1 CoA-binding protein [Deltaproteobacteria bacterium]